MLMDVIWLAATAALTWGAADYFGGASRGRTPVFMIVAVSELFGLCLLTPVLVARGIPPPASPHLLLAAVAGLGVTVELGLIYLALSRGEGFITAPVGALGAAVAATVGLLAGDPLDKFVAVGLACAVVGGGISAWTSDGSKRDGRPLRSAALCAGAAAGLAMAFITLHAASQVDPYWAVAVEHASTALSAVLVQLVVGGRPCRGWLPQVTQLPGLALVAFAGVAGDLAYAIASQHGALSVLSAVSSLYPVATIALGVAIQHQRPGRIQVAGIALALAGAVALGSSVLAGARQLREPAAYRRTWIQEAERPG
jgi:drug/metabolite transporter (DMT)-like permease